MKKLLIVLLVLILIPVLIIAGVYTAVSIPSKVDVTWTQQDLDSYMAKAHADIQAGTAVNTSATGSETDGSKDSTSADKGIPAAFEDLILDNFSSVGSIPVNDVVTSAEATAMINTVSRGNGLFEDVRMKFRDDGTIEASARIGKGIKKISALFPEAKKYENYIQMVQGKTIYWRYNMSRVDDKKFDAHTLELKVGQVPLPLPQARTGLKSVGTSLNNLIEKIDGFTCQDLKIDSAGFHFKGTIPDQLAAVKDENPLIE